MMITRLSARSTPRAKISRGCCVAKRAAGRTLARLDPESDLEFVANAPHCLHESRIGRIGFDFLAQPPDVDSHGAVVAVKLHTPHLIQQLAARKDLPGMARQEPQQVEFFG